MTKFVALDHKIGTVHLVASGPFGCAYMKVVKVTPSGKSAEAELVRMTEAEVAAYHNG